MSEIFHVPPSSELASLRSLVRKINCLSIRLTMALPDRQLVVSRIGDTLFWREGITEGSFDCRCIQGIEVVPVLHLGAKFYTLAFEFLVDGESVRYWLIMSSASEFPWLLQTASKIGALMELEVKGVCSINETDV